MVSGLFRYISHTFSDWFCSAMGCGFLFCSTKASKFKRKLVSHPVFLNLLNLLELDSLFSSFLPFLFKPQLLDSISDFILQINRVWKRHSLRSDRLRLCPSASDFKNIRLSRFQSKLVKLIAPHLVLKNFFKHFGVVEGVYERPFYPINHYGKGKQSTWEYYQEET